MFNHDPDSAETWRLLEEIRAGEATAFDRLFARHRPEVRTFIAFRMDPRLQARLDPSDVVQETHLEVHRRMNDFPGGYRCCRCQRRQRPGRRFVCRRQ